MNLRRRIKPHMGLFLYKSLIFLAMVALGMYMIDGEINVFHLAICAISIHAGRYYSDDKEQTAW